MKGTARVFLALLLVALPLRTASARHADDPREVQGRALFAKGDYQAALDIYAQLFAEKSDPVYLRNVGRCYQKLEQPEKSISAFREYLRRGHVKHAERHEVEGFIKEMEDLEKQKAATTPPPPEPAHASAGETDTAPSVPPVAALTEAPPPAPTESTSAPGATLTQQPATEQPDTGGSIATRWWFWTGLAVLVAGGAAATYVATRPHAGTVPPCANDFMCSNN